MRADDSMVERSDQRSPNRQPGILSNAKPQSRSRVEAQLRELRFALKAAVDGDFSVRLESDSDGRVMRDIVHNFNRLLELNRAMTNEIMRVEQAVRREGRLNEVAAVPAARGSWLLIPQSVNSLISGLVQPTTEVARLISAVAEGDLTQKVALEIEGQPVKGEFHRIGTTVNAMVDQLSSFAAEVTRVAREVGTDGKLGGHTQVKISPR